MLTNKQVMECQSLGPTVSDNRKEEIIYLLIFSYQNYVCWDYSKFGIQPSRDYKNTNQKKTSEFFGKFCLMIQF